MTLAYEVEAELLWKTNVPEVLSQMMRGFDQVNRMVTDLRDSLGELATGGKGIAALNRQLEKLKVPGAALDGLREMGRISANLADVQRGLADSAQRTARAWQDMADAARKMPRGGPGGAGGSGRGGSHVSGMDAAMGAQMFGDAGMGLMERSFHSYADVQLQQVMAQSDKLVTDAVIGRANSIITSLQKQYPALTQAEGLLLFRNSMGIFGNTEESLAALPGAARLQQLYQLAPLGKGGTGGSEVQAAEKAGDAMQEFINNGKLDVGLYNKWMDFQARSYQAGGGLVDAKNWLAFARTSRSAGIGLNERGLEEAQALLEMSPGRTGTALMSAFQVFGATVKHMLPENKKAWGGMGLFGKDGNIIDQQLYQSDPFQWVWSDLVPHLKAHGIKTRDQILRWLTENGQRGTVAGLLSDIAIGQTPITNTANKMERQDPNLVDKLAQTDIGKLAALQAAETNLFVAMGKFAEGPGIALITNLASGLNHLADAMNAHPDAAKNILMVGGGLALMAKVGGDAAMAYLFVGGPIVKGLQGLAGAAGAFAPGAKAGAALEGLAASGGAGSLFGLAAGIVALGAALVGLPPLLKWLTDNSDDAHRFVGNGQGGGRGGHWETKNPAGTWGPGDAPKSWVESLWDSFASGKAAPPGANTQRGHGSGGNSDTGVVHTTINLDGRTIAKVVSPYLARDASGPSRGTTAYDPRMTPMPTGATPQ